MLFVLKKVFLRYVILRYFPDCFQIWDISYVLSDSAYLYL